MSKTASQSGQIGVAIMLMMVVMSTVGFALATRASRDVQTARQAQDAVQTFAAAESIIEDILGRGEAYLAEEPSGSVNDIENIEGTFSVTAQPEQTIDLQEGMIVEVPLFEYGENPTNMNGNRVAVEWAESTNCQDNPASIIVTVINTAGATPVARSIGAAGCNRDDNLDVPSTAPTQPGLTRRVVVSLITGDSTVRVTPLYNSTPVFIEGSHPSTAWELPTQQYRILAGARNDLAGGRESKAIQVERTRDFAPSVLNYSLVSGNSILK